MATVTYTNASQMVQKGLEADLFQIDNWDTQSDDVAGSGNLNYQEVELKLQKEALAMMPEDMAASDSDDAVPRIRGAEEASYIAKQDGYDPVVQHQL